MNGFWYEAMGGLGLEVQRESDRWCFAGIISKKRGMWDVHINPYQDQGFTVSSHRTLDEAKAALMKRYGVTSIVAERVEETQCPF